MKKIFFILICLIAFSATAQTTYHAHYTGGANFTPATGGTVQLVVGQNNIVDSTTKTTTTTTLTIVKITTLASLSLILPSNPVAGVTTFSINCSPNITAVTWSGGTLKVPITTIPAGQLINKKYNSDGTWH